MLDDTDRYLRITKKIDRMPVSLVALIPVAAFKEDSNRVRNMTVLISLLALVVRGGRGRPPVRDGEVRPAAVRGERA
ncbi:hypothetical protein ACFQWB_08225 [Paenibacillus thermoaerophilus]|uniref:Uncharacterized protein n=1 Tax=Paenibacillus thermoaerophilus TaxID=1215385 RepID=A0ABW2V183_9BACL|nr:hypothetical protein [Paenibacillus thermoaerophilus]